VDGKSGGWLIRRGKTWKKMGEDITQMKNIPSQAILLQHWNRNSRKTESVAVELGCLFEGSGRNREVYMSDACDHDFLNNILYRREAKNMKMGIEEL
jgi:hypothetical protein